VQAAHSRNVVFIPDLPVWGVAQRLRIVVDCNHGGVVEFDETMRDFLRDRNNVDGSEKHPFVKGRYFKAGMSTILVSSPTDRPGTEARRRHRCLVTS
jgi:hypothetical protein